MVQIKYVGPDERHVPSLRLDVEPNQVIEVEDPESFIHQDIWQAVKAGKDNK